MRRLLDSLWDKLPSLGKGEKEPLLREKLGPAIVGKVHDRIKSVKNLSEGVSLFELIIELASRASFQPEFEGTSPAKLEEQLWRALDALTVKLHDQFGYAFDLNIIAGNEQKRIPLPVAIDFDRLRDSVAKDNGEYYFRPFYAAPSHANFPASGFDDSHALDLIVPAGTPIKSVASGNVAFSKLDSEIGGNDSRFAGLDNRMDIYLGDLNQTCAYRHLAYISPEKRPKTGQLIKGGDIVGEVGMTGWTTTAHLHFVVYQPHQSLGLISQKLVFAKN
ncbi:MAG: hypothetical protein A2V81_04580 [Candidatus Abawacabacteria bacterium RBG_16_42_10]|uniref:M23ase beta-sheet core domain-containing protein n=1 Tax=Candidatus Abawacabacteria bacterium RBG_16_42_10 TaxID=1817814 RepID=A0A1F4XJD5_9BACT|nr:MAG: hypothetical protein A2V81_04580 [Candidatus Abawacabacteria bacterium RBG_16_42_10]